MKVLNWVFKGSENQIYQELVAGNSSRLFDLPPAQAMLVVAGEGSGDLARGIDEARVLGDATPRSRQAIFQGLIAPFLALACVVSVGAALVV